MNADVAKPSVRAVQPTKNIAAMEALLVVTTAVQRCHSFVAWRSAPVLGDSGIEHTSSIAGITLASSRHPLTADVLRLPSATRSSFILANPQSWPTPHGPTRVSPLWHTPHGLRLRTSRHYTALAGADPSSLGARAVAAGKMTRWNRLLIEIS